MAQGPSHWLKSTIIEIYFSDLSWYTQMIVRSEEVDVHISVCPCGQHAIAMAPPPPLIALAVTPAGRVVNFKDK